MPSKGANGQWAHRQRELKVVLASDGKRNGRIGDALILMVFAGKWSVTGFCGALLSGKITGNDRVHAL